MLLWEHLKKNKWSYGEFTLAMKAITHFMYFLEGAIQKGLLTSRDSKIVQIKSTRGEKNLCSFSTDYFEAEKVVVLCLGEVHHTTTWLIFSHSLSVEAYHHYFYFLFNAVSTERKDTLYELQAFNSNLTNDKFVWWSCTVELLLTF